MPVPPSGTVTSSHKLVRLRRPGTLANDVRTGVDGPTALAMTPILHFFLTLVVVLITANLLEEMASPASPRPGDGEGKSQQRRTGWRSNCTLRRPSRPSSWSSGRPPRRWPPRTTTVSTAWWRRRSRSWRTPGPPCPGGEVIAAPASNGNIRREPRVEEVARGSRLGLIP
jgi:hypothetical protein